MRLKHYNAMWIGCRVPPAGPVDPEEPPIDPCVANLDNDLIAYWDADSIPDIDDIGGRTLANGGDVTSVAGKIGNAFNFPGTSNSYLSAPDDAALRLVGTDFTIRFWIYAESISGTSVNYILYKADYFANLGWWVHLDDFNRVTIVRGDGGTLEWIFSNLPIVLNQWNHAVITFDGSDIRFYLNGVENGGNAVTALIAGATTPLYVGQGEIHALPYYQRFVGLLDEPLISGFAWTQCEVTADYNSGGGRTYPFIELSAPEVDASGFIKLKEPNDNTWHNLKLVNDGGAVSPFVDQTAETEGERGYILMEADDATVHKVELYLDSGVYTYKVEQSASAEAADYSSINLGYGTSARHTVTVINSGGIYELYVNPTPV